MSDTIKVRHRQATSSANPATTVAADAGEILANVADRKVFVRNATGAAVPVADRVVPYNAARQYALDDLTIQADVLYRCTTAITVPEAFNAAKWTAVGAAGGGGDITGAVILAPASTARNTITPTGNFTALTILPAGGQSLSLLNINGTRHDQRGLPVGRYGEAVWLVSQASHPFTVIGQPAAYVHPNWVLARAGDATLSVRAVVHEIIDANNVLLQMSGQVKNLSTAAFVGGAITAGATYFLSSTAGRLSSTPDASGAQAALLATSATTGLLLLSNAAGSAIVSRAPGGQAQTIFEPLSIRNTAGTSGLQINPSSQSITAISGSVSLTFQQDGILAVGGSLSITGTFSTAGNITITNAAPQLLLTETDQTAPAGRYRVLADGGDFSLQEMTAVTPTWTSFLTFDASADRLILKTITNPTVAPSVADADNSVAMTIGIARSWQFAQSGVGAGAALEMRPTGTGKTMRIMDTDRVNGIQISPLTRTLTGIGGAIIVSGDFGVDGELASAGNLTVPSAAIGVFDINVVGGTFSRREGSIVYNVPTGHLHVFRINNAEGARVEVAGTAVASSLAIITAQKGDARYASLTANQTIAGLKTFSGEANFTDGLIAERIRIGVKTIDTIDNLSASLLFDVPAASVHAFYAGGIEIGRIQASATVGLTTVVTVDKGDARYVRGVGGILQIDRGGTAANDAAEARANLGANNATNLTAGILPAARLGATSADETWVGARISGMTTNQVGTYGFCSCPDTVTPGSLYAGSSLRYAGWRNGGITEHASTLSGQWQAFGEMSTSDNDCVTLFMRVS